MKLIARMGHSSNPDASAAIDEIAGAVAQEDASVILFYCSPRYDLRSLAAAIQRRFPKIPVIGATSAGQLGPGGLQSGGISALSMKSPMLTVRTYLAPITDDPHAAGQRLGRQVREDCRALGRAFGLLLVDGLSLAEERLTSALYRSTGILPIIGGSAADELTFTETHVFIDGAFHRNAAVFVMFETWLPFRTFQVHHFEPTSALCVVTAADPIRRIVYEIDGRPALDAYSELIDTPKARIDAGIFAEHPLMQKVGQTFFVRSIARSVQDGALAMLCALEEGTVLNIGRSTDLVAQLDRQLAALDDAVGPSGVILSCDCVLRRLEIERKGLRQATNEVLERHHVFGFSTYGEQFNSLHVNQTMTGIAIGAEL